MERPLAGSGVIFGRVGSIRSVLPGEFPVVRAAVLVAPTNDARSSMAFSNLGGLAIIVIRFIDQAGAPINFFNDFFEQFLGVM